MVLCFFLEDDECKARFFFGCLCFGDDDDDDTEDDDDSELTEYEPLDELYDEL